jgi:ribonuclease-3
LQDTRGLAHAQTFQVECHIAPLSITTLGEGSSRKAAEQQAAEAALAKLEAQGRATEERHPS